MLVEYLKSKIHGAVITQTNIDYVGSITIDKDLMKAAKLLPNEKVAVFNFSNTNRFETYVIEGKKGSKIIGLNGPAAQLGKIGEKVVIVSYTLLSPQKGKTHKPNIVIVDKKNNII